MDPNLSPIWMNMKESVFFFTQFTTDSTYRIFLPLLALVSTFLFTFLRSFWSSSHCLKGQGKNEAIPRRTRNKLEIIAVYIEWSNDDKKFSPAIINTTSNLVISRRCHDDNNKKYTKFWNARAGVHNLKLRNGGNNYLMSLRCTLLQPMRIRSHTRGWLICVLTFPFQVGCLSFHWFSARWTAGGATVQEAITNHMFVHG